MKLITAVFKPFKLDAVRESLINLDVSGMTISEVRGFGQQRGHTEHFGGEEYVLDYLPKVKIEIVSEDCDVDIFVDSIRKATHTGKAGDGKIWVVDLSEVVRIRTGETGSEAI